MRENSIQMVEINYAIDQACTVQQLATEIRCVVGTLLSMLEARTGTEEMQEQDFGLLYLMRHAEGAVLQLEAVLPAKLLHSTLAEAAATGGASYD